jgi:chromosome segregation ATPase
MTDADKILHALAEMQRDVKSLQTDVKGLQEGQKSLGHGQKSLQEGQQALRKEVDQQRKAIAELREGQKMTDLKVEAFQAEQKQASVQILTMLTDMNEINAKAIDTRVTRIEKHLNFPPVKQSPFECLPSEKISCATREPVVLMAPRDRNRAEDRCFF